MLAVGGVDVDQDEAQVVAGVLDDGPFPAVGGPDADAVALAVAGADEGGGQAEDAVVEPLVGEGHVGVDVDDALAGGVLFDDRLEVFAEGFGAQRGGALVDAGADDVRHLVAVVVYDVFAVGGGDGLELGHRILLEFCAAGAENYVGGGMFRALRRLRGGRFGASGDGFGLAEQRGVDHAALEAERSPVVAGGGEQASGPVGFFVGGAIGVPDDGDLRGVDAHGGRVAEGRGVVGYERRSQKCSDIFGTRSDCRAIKT